MNKALKETFTMSPFIKVIPSSSKYADLFLHTLELSGLLLYNTSTWNHLLPFEAGIYFCS